MGNIIKIKRVYNVPLIERIENLIFYSPCGCWYWLGNLNEHLRAKMTINGRSCAVSRVMYTLFKSDIPEGLCALHTCDNPMCVNPYHLFLGTKKDNTHDMLKKGRSNSARGSKSGNSKLTDNQVIQIRQLKGKMTLAKIGEQFGITKENVWYIHRNHTWRHVPLF